MSDLHPLTAKVLETDTIKDSDYLATPNEFHGVDFSIPAGSVRLASEFSDPGEGVTLYRFTRNFILEWSVRFDGSTPLPVVCATVAEALGF